jgi:hypothetical protein
MRACCWRRRRCWARGSSCERAAAAPAALAAHCAVRCASCSTRPPAGLRQLPLRQPTQPAAAPPAGGSQVQPVPHRQGAQPLGGGHPRLLLLAGPCARQQLWVASWPSCRLCQRLCQAAELSAAPCPQTLGLTPSALPPAAIPRSAGASGLPAAVVPRRPGPLADPAAGGAARRRVQAQPRPGHAAAGGRPAPGAGAARAGGALPAHDHRGRQGGLRCSKGSCDACLCWPRAPWPGLVASRVGAGEARLTARARPCRC